MKRRALLLTMLASILSLLTGCTTLPAINATEISYESNYPMVGGTSILVTDVVVTETEVKAGSYTRNSKWGGFSQVVKIKGYSRARTPDTKPEIIAP